MLLPACEATCLCFQEEEESHLQKAERLYSLMTAVTDKVRGAGLQCVLNRWLDMVGHEVKLEAQNKKKSVRTAGETPEGLAGFIDYWLLISDQRKLFLQSRLLSVSISHHVTPSGYRQSDVEQHKITQPKLTTNCSFINFIQPQFQKWTVNSLCKMQIKSQKPTFYTQ